MKPFFSVIIPTYNRAEKLRLTVDSVIAQTFSDFEILVMDDGSTDNTKAVIESFHDPRVYYDWAHNSGGPATPRNRGVEAARADWICFLDADDLWYPDKLKKVAEAIANDSGFDLICHDMVISVLATGQKSLVKFGPFEENFYQVMLTQGSRLTTSATTVKRDFLNKYGLRFNTTTDYVIVEDFDMWLRIAFEGGVFHFISEPLCKYIVDDDNISLNFAKLHRNYRTLLHDHVYKLQTFQPDKDRLWQNLEAHLLLLRAKNMISNKQFLGGTHELISAFRTSLEGSVGYFVLRFKKYFYKVFSG